MKSLPMTHVPEKAQEDLVAIVQEQGMDGNAFSSYVQTVPPDICAPKHAMKLKAAWKNVLAEAEACAIAKNNADAAESAPRKEGVKLVC